MSNKRIIFHIDVNSAFLSWEAVHRLQRGSSVDIRTIPSIVGGDPATRRGIVLAKSIPARKYNIKTGESILQAAMKCPDLLIIRPHYDLYLQASSAMIDILRKYSSKIQRFSIDEAFLDYTHSEKLFGDPVKAANKIREYIREELGFTVNIGISTNKLLAKMAGELEKPDKTITLYPEEIPEKLWPLHISELFMCGPRTVPKLEKRGIYTIGDLANSDINMIRGCLKSHGTLLWNYANGIESSPVRNEGLPIKGIGNSTTTPEDLYDRKFIKLYILALVEMVAMRLRAVKKCAQVLSLHLRDNLFNNYSHQRKMGVATDSTTILYQNACQLFDEIWNKEGIRHVGVHASELQDNDFHQTSFFDFDTEKYKSLDNTIDEIRLRYGDSSIMRSVMIRTGVSPMIGGVASNEDEYPAMSSLL